MTSGRLPKRYEKGKQQSGISLPSETKLLPASDGNEREKRMKKRRRKSDRDNEQDEQVVFVLETKILLTS